MKRRNKIGRTFGKLVGQCEETLGREDEKPHFSIEKRGTNEDLEEKKERISSLTQEGKALNLLLEKKNND